MKKIALLTSGGDAPGMNAHIRAVQRTCEKLDVDCYGVYGGYQGLISGEIEKLHKAHTVNILAQGGTILKTSRCMEFHTEEGRAKAAYNLKTLGIDGLITCGGDGTFHGAHALWDEHKIPVVGTPGTIDNDLYGTYYTIGFDTAINTAAEAIDRIRDTADSHGRVFIIEVMGRHAGHIAMDVGIACGAEYVSVPEAVTNLEILYERYCNLGEHSRTIFIIGEGGDFGGASDLANNLKEKYDIDSKVAILGHIQRGGSPTVKDRVLASHLGSEAVKALLSGKTDVMVGRIYHEIKYTPLEDTWNKRKKLHNYLFELVDLFA